MLYQLGLAYYQSYDYSTAENYFLKAIRANPGNKHAYFHLAVFAKKEGNLPKAKSLLRKGFKKEDEFQKAFEELSRIDHSD